MSRLLAVVLTAVPLALTTAGCGIYGGDDPCDEWAGPTNEAAPDQVPGVRNPATGQCEYRGGGGGGGGNNCGDWGGAPAVPQEPVDWGMCVSHCTGLDEQSCMNTDGCRAIQVSNCPEGLDCDNTEYTYFECWATAPSGPVTGSCAGLDAYECSRHDNCVARHYPLDGCTGGTGSGDCAPGFIDPNQVGNFESCVDEPTVPDGCYSDAECPSGTHCNADEVCLTPPGGCGGTGTGGEGVPCDFACWGYCVPDNSGPGSCTGDISCRAEPPDCPVNTVPGRLNGCWTGYCIPIDACDPPIDPGRCYGEVACDSIPPTCPTGTTPGIVDGCWTGYCVPMTDCEPPPACSEVGNEQACIARTDCSPLYEGVNCTCQPDGTCSCERWDYTACSTN